MPEHLLNIKEAANYLGLSEKKLKELVQKRIIPAYKIGGLYLRFKKSQLDTIKPVLLPQPTRESLYQAEKTEQGILESIKDFLYFNDFYIISLILVILAVVFIFTSY